MKKIKNKNPPPTCEGCGKYLTEYEIEVGYCTTCAGFPVHMDCGGQGCKDCNWTGEIHPKKEYDI